MGLFSSLFGKKPAAPQAQEEQAQQERSSIDELREGLEGSDGGARIDAARELLDRWRNGELQAAEVFAPRLPDLLDDAEPLVRISALQGVRLLRKPENVQACESGVLALLADAVPQVRTAALWAAIRLPGDAARAQVRAALQSPEETLRFAAACALADVGDAAALPELSAALRDGYRRQEALSALMSLGDTSALPEVAALFDDESLGEFDRTLVAAAMVRFGDPRGAAHLVSRIETDSDDRPIAAEWAGRLGVQDAVPALSELARSEGDPAQGAAIRALGRLKAPGAEERLLELAADAGAAEDLRMDALEGLAELETPAALDLLRKIAESGPAELSQLCRELLAEVQANAG
ncbi:MAG TPA: HEAT repeat domain-containing protein [Myxococcales bacterium]